MSGPPDALHQCLDESRRRDPGRIEVMTELSPDKDAAMETDKRNPFRLPGDEERARTLLSAPWNVQGGL